MKWNALPTRSIYPTLLARTSGLCNEPQVRLNLAWLHYFFVDRKHLIIGLR
jgi:hypothetical protein